MARTVHSLLGQTQACQGPDEKWYPPCTFWGQYLLAELALYRLLMCSRSCSMTTATCIGCHNVIATFWAQMAVTCLFCEVMKGLALAPCAGCATLLCTVHA